MTFDGWRKVYKTSSGDNEVNIPKLTEGEVLDLEKLRVDEKKPDARPGGIVHVYVNGQAVLENGVYLGGQAGQVVLKR